MYQGSPHNRYANLPETVYKYRHLDEDEHTLRILTHGTLFLASASSFNDPFDTTLGYDFNASRKTKRSWTISFLKRHHPNLNRDARRREARKILAGVTAAGPGRPQLAQDLLKQQRFDQHGIFCAAAVRDDLLMWAHYADRHSGICIGLSREGLTKVALAEFLSGRVIEPYNVRYQDELDRPSFFYTPPTDEWPEWHGRVVAVKSTHWAYEQEVRLVSWNGAGVVIEGGPDLVSEVVLGCQITPDDEARVLDALRSVGSKALVYRARRHDKRFELVIDLVDATLPT